MSEPRGKYLRQKAKYIATINKGSITIETTEYKGEYDGQKHPALTDVKVEPEDAKLTYSINNGEYSDEIPEVEMTGKYTVSIRAEKEGYNTIEITKTVTINRQKNREGNLTLSETSGIITYPIEKTIEVTSNTSGGELSISSSDETVLTAKLEGNTITMTPQIIETDEKKVTITVKSKETENYEEQTATYDAVVNRGSITISATPYTGTYNGNSYPAVSNVSTEPPNCTLTYSLNNVEYSEGIPQISNANTYTLTIKAEKAGYVTKEESRTITINKQGNISGNLVLSETSGTLNYPTTRTFTVVKNTSGGELSVVSGNTNVVTASISGNTITLTPKEVNSTATITVKAKATGNYTEQTATYTATVISNKAPSKPTVSFNSKGTNYLTVNARSTDTDQNDKLTYTLRYGTSSSNLSYSTDLPNQTPGNSITLTASTNVSPYTYYYWRVDVTDGKAVAQGDIQYGPRTYCAASPCSGGSSTYHSCPKTVSSGRCTGTLYRRGAGAGGISSSTCYFCGKGDIAGSIDFAYCSVGAGSHFFQPTVCFSCMASLNTVPCPFQNETTCTTCNGNGYYYTYSTCAHGYNYGSSHYYCDISGHGSYRGASSLHD